LASSIYSEITHFNIGTWISPGAAGILNDTYSRASLTYFNGGGSSQYITLDPYRWTEEANPALGAADNLLLNQPTNVPHYSPGTASPGNVLLQRVSQIYDIKPKNIPVALSQLAQLVIRYTNEDLNFDLDGAGQTDQNDRNVVENNIGLYRLSAGTAPGATNISLVNDPGHVVYDKTQHLVTYLTTDLNSQYVLLSVRNPPTIQNFYADPAISNDSAASPVNPTFHWSVFDPTARHYKAAISVQSQSGQAVPGTATISGVLVPGSNATQTLNLDGTQTLYMSWDAANSRFDGSNQAAGQPYQTNPWNSTAWASEPDGLYIARLTVTDDLGNSSSSQTPIIKGAPQPAIQSVAGTSTQNGTSYLSMGPPSAALPAISISGSQVNIQGSAFSPAGFKDYTLQIRSDDGVDAPGNWIGVPVSIYANNSGNPLIASQQVNGGTLAQLDSTKFADGLYDLQLAMDISTPDPAGGPPVASSTAAPIVYRVQISNRQNSFGCTSSNGVPNIYNFGSSANPFKSGTHFFFSQAGNSGATNVVIQVLRSDNSTAAAFSPPFANSTDLSGNDVFTTPLWQPTDTNNQTYTVVFSNGGCSSSPTLSIDFAPNPSSLQAAIAPIPGASPTPVVSGQITLNGTALDNSSGDFSSYTLAISPPPME
jgi:hypothetical protein